jgi:hypothetical protein
MFMGAIFGLIIGPLSFAVGAACGFGIGSLGFAAATLSAIAITGCIAFVCGAGFGFSVGGFASTNAPAVSLGLGGSPLLVSVPFLLLDLRVESLYIAAIILGLGFTQALGGYVGCRLALPRCKPQLGIGHTCANCNYDLTATADHMPCPECGHLFRLAPPDSATSTNQPPYSPPN